MKNMRKTVEINSITYELKPQVTRSQALSTRRYSNIFEAYNKPSVTKQEIWKKWVGEIQELESFAVWVTSRNTDFFSIGAIVEHEGKQYFINITPSHNYIHPVAC